MSPPCLEIGQPARRDNKGRRRRGGATEAGEFRGHHRAQASRCLRGAGRGGAAAAAASTQGATRSGCCSLCKGGGKGRPAGRPHSASRSPSYSSHWPRRGGPPGNCSGACLPPSRPFHSIPPCLALPCLAPLQAYSGPARHCVRRRRRRLSASARLSGDETRRGPNLLRRQFTNSAPRSPARTSIRPAGAAQSWFLPAAGIRGLRPGRLTLRSSRRQVVADSFPPHLLLAGSRSGDLALRNRRRSYTGALLERE